MDAISKAARTKFRQLATLDIDPEAVLRGKECSGNFQYLLRAIEVADAIFWQQVMPEITPEALLSRAGGDSELKEMLLFNYGPYDRLNDDVPFLPDVPEREAGAGFYPPGVNREELAGYLREGDQSKNSFESPFTVIRQVNGTLRAVPFHEAYRNLITELQVVLKQAAGGERHPAFRDYLLQKAHDVGTDDFYASDSLWVKLVDNPVDLVIGPYEVYHDELMGLKAAYEGILLSRNFEDTERVQYFQKDLPNMCTSLERELNQPLFVDERRVRISVADLAYAGGDAHKAIPAIAFNLPNDERIIEEVGARQVLLHNVVEAKFRLVGWEVIKRVLDLVPEDQDAAFQSFFTFIILHEISHSIGHHRIVKDGQETTVNRCLRQHYSTLEEAKADALGACLTVNSARQFDTATFLQTYVGNLLRSIRFGFGEAHGGANAIQFNYLLAAGAIRVDAVSKRISIKYKEAIRSLQNLAAEILSIQGHGDIDAAAQLIANFRTIRPELRDLIAQTADLPIDLRIRFSGRASRTTDQRLQSHYQFDRPNAEVKALQSLNH
jgi:Peptidase family M49